MKMNFALISILIFVPAVSGFGQSNSWKGLTPLRSTRTDVEKLLGQPKKKSYDDCCDYQIEKDSVKADYAERQCDEGWDVPKDTLINIFFLTARKSRK